MGFFSSPPVQKKGITPGEYLHHRLYAKIRAVFPYSTRGMKRLKALNEAIDVEEDTKHHHPPHLKRVLEEETLEDKLKRLIAHGLMTEKEAEKIRVITQEDLRN
jgi:hypothetical protein